MKSALNSVHHAAAKGYSNTADNYVLGRPGYPPDITGWLRNELGIHPEMTVIDLGAGTGKFTPYLVETGADVIAIEPVSAMLNKLSAALPRVKTHSGSAEAIPLPAASVDVVVCAQTFHWFATAAALAEIQRILKPGGRLGLVWNVRDERVDWVARLTTILNRVEGDTPRYYTGAWRKLFPFHGFGPLHEHHFPHSHTGTPEDVLINRVKSISFIAALSAGEQAHIVEQVRQLIAAEPTLVGKDVVTMPYETATYYTVKTGS